jgi:glycosyltransferase involved in cell wall biosynthesis
MRRPRGQFIFAPTGLGFAQTQTASPKSWALRRIMPSTLRRLGGARAGWIFENEDDARIFGFGGNGAARKLVVGGAGVDIEGFAPRPLPPLPPLRVAMVSRMIHSKGPDLAVAAVGKLRNAGYSIELTLAGDADPFNPRPMPGKLLEQWKNTPGIRWIGRQSDVAALWADHHLACLPSRGGEGLPKSLLEAAACGRAIVTTDVPGCRDLVRHGVEGLLVPPGSADALAAALRRFLDQPELVAHMGAAARERVQAGYSERQVASAVMDFYGRLTNVG